MAVSYTAVVDVDGEGRNGGHVPSADGLLETSLALPKELGGAGTATNPEQLLAAGWAACFLGALRRAATLLNDGGIQRVPPGVRGRLRAGRR